MRKQFLQEKTKDMVEFSTKKPAGCLNSIKQGLGVGKLLGMIEFAIWYMVIQVLSYGQSEYIQVSLFHIVNKINIYLLI